MMREGSVVIGGDTSVREPNDEEEGGGKIE